MSIRIDRSMVLAMVLLGAAGAESRAEEPAPRRATPIIFSDPKSDSVSSNLNQLSRKNKSSAITDLESGLSKPFEVFDSVPSADGFQGTPYKFNLPAPTLSNKKLKDLLDKQIEQSYLLPDGKDDSPAGDELLGREEDPFTPAGRKLETRLDRYYDRIDRSRSGMTNEVRKSDSLGDKKGADEKEELSREDFNGLFNKKLPSSVRSLPQATNSTSEGGWLMSEKRQPKAFSEIFGLNDVTPARTAAREQDKDVRLNEFKRLLDGPAYSPRNDFNGALPPLVSAPAQATKPVSTLPVPSWSSSTQPAVKDSFANSSGLVGAPGSPQGLSDFGVGAPSLTPATSVSKPLPPRQQPPKPEFKIPKSKF
jgi:hypothetical protein